MAGPDFNQLEDIFDRHARRMAREIGSLLVDFGDALRKAAEPPQPPPNRPTAEPTRDDLLREAARLGIRGRSRMSKEELRSAVAQAQQT